MEFFVRDTSKSINDIMRTLGYRATHLQPGDQGGHHDDEFSMVRKLGKNDYPRFHLYVKQMNGGDAGYSFNLHLDQKKPSYNGTSAHSGEYHGDLVEDEVKRIKHLIL